jgi:hypothetical protein
MKGEIEMIQSPDILAYRGAEQSLEPDEWPITATITVVSEPLALRLLLQECLHEVGAIIRGRRLPSTESVPLGMRGRALDYYHNADGQVIIGALDRSAVWTVDLQVAWFENRFPDTLVLLVVGNGNLGANDGFVCYVGEPAPDQRASDPWGLFCPPDFGLWRGDAYPSLVITRDGTAMIDRLTYEGATPSDDGFQRDARVACESGLEPRAVLWATTGQQVVRDGKPLAFEEYLDLCCRGRFTGDLNHVLGFAFLKAQDLKGSVFCQVEYRALVDQAGQPVPEVLAAAMRGDPVEVPIGKAVWGDQLRYGSRREFVADLRESLRKRGYVEVTEPERLGEFRIRRNTMTVCFLPGTYPHSLIGVSRAGRIVLIQLSYPGGGKMVGGRSAVTVMGAARLALTAANRALGPYQDQLADCLLIDQGGDCTCLARESNRGWTPRVASEIGRDSLRSLIAVVGTSVAQVPPSDVWLAEDLLCAGWQKLAGGSALIRSGAGQG